jgi:hypothetical protein
MKQKRFISFLLIAVTIALVGTGIYVVSTRQTLSSIPIIQQNGFSNDDAELIIDAVVRAGAKRKEILQINEMINGKVGVITGDSDSYGPKRGGGIGYNGGTLYYLIKNGGEWQIESTVEWIE